MATNFVPDARSYATAEFPTLVRAAQFPLPAHLETFVQAWSYLGDVEDAVFTAVNAHLASRTSWTATQKASYASLRTAWQDAQVTLYTLTRAFFMATFPDAAANSYAASLGYPGWLPKADAAGITPPLTPDMRDRDGKRYGIGVPGTRTLATLEAQYPQMRMALAWNPDGARAAVGKLYAVGLAARFFASLFTSAAPSPDAAGVVVREVAYMRRTPRWPFYVLGGLLFAGFIYYATKTAPRRGARGLAATRLTSLSDKVPSRYGLEV